MRLERVILEKTDGDGMPTGQFLYIDGYLDRSNPSGRLGWTECKQWAFSLLNEEQALVFIGMILDLSDKLPHKYTLQGLRRGDYLPHIINEPKNI